MSVCWESWTESSNGVSLWTLHVASAHLPKDSGCITLGSTQNQIHKQRGALKYMHVKLTPKWDIKKQPHSFPFPSPPLPALENSMPSFQDSEIIAADSDPKVPDTLTVLGVFVTPWGIKQQELAALGEAGNVIFWKFSQSSYTL